MQNSSDDDTLAPRRRVKQQKSWKTEGTKTWENASQKKYQEAVFNSDSGSDKAAAKQHSPQQAQSERMYLRRGRSYFRERNLMGSESEGSSFSVNCAEDSVSAIQTPGGKIKTLLNQKHLQRVVQSEKHSTLCLDSDNSSTQSQVQKSADSEHLFTPPDPTKGCRRKALKQKSKLVTPMAPMAGTEDSGFFMQQGKVINKKIRKRQKKFSKEYEKYMLTDSGDESPPSDMIKDKSKNSKSTLNRTGQRKSSRVSERTTNGHAPLVDKDPEQSKRSDDPQPFVLDNAGKKPKPSVNSKMSRKNNKEQTANHPEIEQDLEGAWTDKELQKLNE